MTPILTVGLKVPVEGSWIIFTEAAGVLIVKSTFNRNVAFEVRFNLGGEDPVLDWGWRRERKTRKGGGGGRHP